jgi:hypothetical protein
MPAIWGARPRPARPAIFGEVGAETFTCGPRFPISCPEAQESSRPAMNAPSELSFEEMLRIKLEVLRREHRDLDQAIHALEETGRPDQLTLRRLKKQKLALKDQIVKIEDQLIPDIIA